MNSEVAAAASALVDLRYAAYSTPSAASSSSPDASRDDASRDDNPTVRGLKRMRRTDCRARPTRSLQSLFDGILWGFTVGRRAADAARAEDCFVVWALLHRKGTLFPMKTAYENPPGTGHGEVVVGFHTMISIFHPSQAPRWTSRTCSIIHWPATWRTTR